VSYDDGTSARTTVSIPTPAFDDPTGVYDHLRVVKARTADVTPGFDFLYIKSDIAGPVVLDTDGEVRWWVPGGIFARSSAFSGDSFIVGDDDTLVMTRVRLDGKVTTSTLAGDYLWFHHNAEPGKQGLLFELDRSLGSVIDVEDIVAEIDADGKVVRQWDFGDILSAYMREHGDDPSGFIRNGIDWFHVNSALYDPRDDSLIVSSRENFVIKIGYATNDIRWIFGDPTKGWYTLYPSLREKAVLLDAGGLYPVGQHSLSLTPEGSLLLFNNGRNSISPPIGGNPGENRTYSAMSAYTIDPVARTAKEVLRFDNGQAEFSQFCGSAYEAGSSFLVTYTQADRATHARLLGLDSTLRVAFEFELTTVGCQTSWNAIPIAFGELNLR